MHKPCILQLLDDTLLVVGNLYSAFKIDCVIDTGGGGGGKSNWFACVVGTRVEFPKLLKLTPAKYASVYAAANCWFDAAPQRFDPKLLEYQQGATDNQ